MRAEAPARQAVQGRCEGPALTRQAAMATFFRSYREIGMFFVVLHMADIAGLYQLEADAASRASELHGSVVISLRVNEARVLRGRLSVPWTPTCDAIISRPTVAIDPR